MISKAILYGLLIWSLLVKGGGFTLKTPKQGAGTILRAALDPTLDGKCLSLIC